MLQTIIQACENFCIHQIRLPHTLEAEKLNKRTLIAYIDVNTLEGTQYRVYFASESGFAQRISLLFLEEDESDEETLIDMILETANLIVGSAKVLASRETKAFTIKTPYFCKVDVFDFEFDASQTFRIEEDAMMIAIKELNG